ncbi:MAG: hypothetical protein GXY53_07335 [Desulfobulbus sp.]|nr:hypothetical protein [Desulfobulbus sp.]
MSSRLLLINCASPYFFYIPMGCFGLCDLLAREGIEARLLNPALYTKDRFEEQLSDILDSLQPTHVGFACHWQETTHGLLEALKLVRSWSSTVLTFAGGFTASYFAEDLLRSVPELDCVVIGDPEEPVLQLVQGHARQSIANLVWKENGTVRRNSAMWLINQQLFDQLAFTDCSCLLDAELYIDKINTILGFPLLLGRGCIFDCAYCGGSRHAFRLHSGRALPVVRSLPSVLADLHRLKNWTDVLYICYENDPAMIKTLFRAIGDDPVLRGHFTLNYGAWHLLDNEFLELYQYAFNLKNTRPVFEFSPEVTGDKHRKEIKRGHTYELTALEENLHAVTRTFNGEVRLEAFFSRYHPTLTASDMEEEIKAILLFKHRMFCAGLPVHVRYDHLSSDVASRYWEEQQQNPRDFRQFLTLKQEVDSGNHYPFPVDNLCLLPPPVKDEFLVQHEALLLVLELMEKHCHELFHILLASMETRWLQVLSTTLEPFLTQEKTTSFFTTTPLNSIIQELGTELGCSSLWQPSFLADLIRFSVNKLTLAPEPQTGTRPALCGTDEVQLDRSRMSVHEQDYLDLLPLLQQLAAGKQQPIPYQRTVCLFTNRGIITVPHRFYRTTLRLLEQPTAVAAYQAALERDGRIDWQQHKQILSQLYQEGVLVTTN